MVQPPSTDPRLLSTSLVYLMPLIEPSLVLVNVQVTFWPAIRVTLAVEPSIGLLLHVSPVNCQPGVDTSATEYCPGSNPLKTFWLVSVTLLSSSSVNVPPGKLVTLKLKSCSSLGKESLTIVKLPSLVLVIVQLADRLVALIVKLLQVLLVSDQP